MPVEPPVPAEPPASVEPPVPVEPLDSAGGFESSVSVSQEINAKEIRAVARIAIFFESLIKISHKKPTKSHDFRPAFQFVF